VFPTQRGGKSFVGTSTSRKVNNAPPQLEWAETGFDKPSILPGQQRKVLGREANPEITQALLFLQEPILVYLFVFKQES